MGHAAVPEYNVHMWNKRPASSGAETIWDTARLADPHGQRDKRRRVRAMFEAIAPTYERVNRWASAGRDAHWRREMVRLADVHPGDVLLDVACGTGDVVRSFLKGPDRPRYWVGIDLATNMLRHARAPAGGRGVFVQADALHLPVADEQVTIVTCAFGLRNFAHLQTGLREMYRVLRDGGRAILLEFSLPRHAALRAGYLFYFRRLLPHLATWLSGDATGAYRYLPESVLSFYDAQAIRSALLAAGFDGVSAHRKSCGIVTIHVARKSLNSSRDTTA